ncbi:thermonuclease family protein [Microbacterium allomyrinae]|uniref:Thermonuclease family protein n=1 Tax=Microbacterium allomyrinae TaxID=2830666 RepID=A0A9X1LXT9_9MICO|nr:thermonuclease family protein [Microbacterium allomyrinae]MCC2033681.1 thermonuclease family protein [Microbacterium allomyrinae]
MARSRRFRRAVVVLAALALAGVLAWLVLDGRLPWAGGDAAAPAATDPAAPGRGIPARPDDAFALTVTYVFDGDTIEARMQEPNDIVTTADPIRIRLIGIDTPEGAPTPECWAEEARAHLIELLPEGATVWAAPDADTWDDYQRRLFNLWTDDGRFVNHELVAAGSAEAIRVWPNVAFYDLLDDAQTHAEASGAGQWGACP